MIRPDGSTMWRVEYSTYKVQRCCLSWLQPNNKANSAGLAGRKLYHKIFREELQITNMIHSIIKRLIVIIVKGYYLHQRMMTKNPSVKPESDQSKTGGFAVYFSWTTQP